VRDNKLTGEKSRQALERKTNFLNHRLSPLLSQISLDYRISLWKMLIKSLFNSLLPFFSHNNKNRTKKLEILLKILKKFTKLSTTTDDVVLEKLIEFDILKLTRDQESAALSKWRQRLAFVLTSPPPQSIP